MQVSVVIKEEVALLWYSEEKNKQEESLESTKTHRHKLLQDSPARNFPKSRRVPQNSYLKKITEMWASSDKVACVVLA